jgi:uncharacterized protein DUF3606
MRSQASEKRYVIDVSKPWHVAWWAAEFGVSEDCLLDMVNIVGNQARAVEYYLGLRDLRELREQRKTVAPATATVAPTLVEM